jgi:aspartate kinase
MKVFKFGGASVKDASGIRNLAKIVSGEKRDLVIVVSALGKTTNALEILLKTWLAGNSTYKDHLEAVYLYHMSVSDELFSGINPAQEQIDISFASLKEYLSSGTKEGYDYEYDQIVSYGEIWSTIIVAEYLKVAGIMTEWVDIRKSLITDSRFRDANILWNESEHRIKNCFDFLKSSCFITQGFIGGTAEGHITTLGREGSDYTAAILANILNAESVTVWKDVPGLLNADPKWLPGAIKMNEVSYREAVEMTFSGAKVIHPKTIKPLHNKNIPLYIKSFLSPEDEGTLVTADPELGKVIPVFIRKENQVLLSLLPKDLSFVMGENLSMMFRVFMKHGIKVNLVEASAVSIDVCVDDERPKVEALIGGLKNKYSVLYNEKVELLTIRHYTTDAVTRITNSREVLLEQRTRSSVRFVVRKEYPPTPLKGG